MKCALAAAGFINGDIEYNKAVLADTLGKCAGKADAVIFGEAFLQGFAAVAKVDNGSVLFCQPDLLHKDEIAAKWLFYSLYQYAASERFVPEQTMEPGQIEKMYG